MLTSFPFLLAVGTVLGFLTGLGIGGGSLLILWLTMVMAFPQETARSINLLFFLPAAVLSSLFRAKQGNLNLPRILPAIVSGCAAAILFSWLGFAMNTQLLRKAFGVLLLATGIRELTIREKRE